MQQRMIAKLCVTCKRQPPWRLHIADNVLESRAYDQLETHRPFELGERVRERIKVSAENQCRRACVQ